MYQYTFMYISVYLRSLIPSSFRGISLTFYMLITPSHHSLSFQLKDTLHCSTYCKEHTCSDNESTFCFLVITSYQRSKSSIFNIVLNQKAYIIVHCTTALREKVSIGFSKIVNQMKEFHFGYADN